MSEENESLFHLAAFGNVAELNEALNRRGLGVVDDGGDDDKKKIASTIVNKGDNDLPTGTLFHIAAYTGQAEVVNTVVNRGFDIDAKNADGDTALHVAISRRNYAVAAALTNQQAIVRLHNKQGESALQCAVVHGGGGGGGGDSHMYLEMLKTMYSSMNRVASDAFMETKRLIFAAAESNNVVALHYLLFDCERHDEVCVDVKDNYLLTPVMTAYDARCDAVVDALISYGAERPETRALAAKWHSLFSLIVLLIISMQHFALIFTVDIPLDFVNNAGAAMMRKVSLATLLLFEDDNGTYNYSALGGFNSTFLYALAVAYVTMICALVAALQPDVVVKSTQIYCLRTFVYLSYTLMWIPVCKIFISAIDCDTSETDDDVSYLHMEPSIVCKDHKESQGQFTLYVLGVIFTLMFYLPFRCVMHKYDNYIDHNESGSLVARMDSNNRRIRMYEYHFLLRFPNRSIYKYANFIFEIFLVFWTFPLRRVPWLYATLFMIASILLLIIISVECPYYHAIGNALLLGINAAYVASGFTSVVACIIDAVDGDITLITNVYVYGTMLACMLAVTIYAYYKHACTVSGWWYVP